MNFYQQEILRIKEELYPKDYLLKQVVDAKLYIERNYADKIELKDIAGEAYFSKFHFIKLFKRVCGVTPYQYLKTVRIENAKKLLQAGKPVTDVAFSVGFDSVTSFTGFFKKTTGMSPSLYQKKQQLLRALTLQVPLKYNPPYTKK